MSDAGEGTESTGAQISVQLLGSVAAFGPDGTQINVGGPKPRTALAILALRSGEIVSTDALVDALWDDDPPPTARRSVQAHVARLRSALGGEAGPLSPQSSGYLLDLAPDQVDVRRIEAAVAEARETLSTDPWRALTLLRDSEQRWAGPPLADLEGNPTIDAHRERLRKLEDSLGDTLLEAEVAAGDPAALLTRLEGAATDQPTHEPHWRRLISTYYAAGRQRDALDAYRRATAALEEHLGVDPSPQLRRLETRILQQSLPETDADHCPYKGLTSYQIADGAEFHGRGHDVDELVALIGRAPLSFVVGPSGVGKSSVLRAGLAYRILNGAVEGINTVDIITPGAQPTRALYGATAGVDLLIIDQFEELFTLTESEERRAAFVRDLEALVRDGRTRVLLAVRADFYGHCLAMASLAPLLGRHQVNIGAMSSASLREAIIGPAEAAGLQVEEALLDELLDEVTDRPGALPLLSHALSETWRRRQGDILTLEGYQAAGSLGGAIAATAERIHEGLDRDARRSLELLFRRLVEPGVGVAHTRRRVETDEIISSGTDEGLVARLIEARLLSAGPGEVEIAHEALIEAWPRMRTWIDGERDEIALHRGLTRAAEAWRDSDRDPSELYRGNRLVVASTWHDERSPPLSSLETDFLHASQEEAAAEDLRSRRTTRRLKLLTTVSVVGLAMALIAGAMAIQRSNDADQRRREAEVASDVAIASTDPTLTGTDRLTIAAALVEREPTTEAAALLLDALVVSPAIVERGDLDIASIAGRSPTTASGLALLVADVQLSSAAVFGPTVEVIDQEFGFVPLAIQGRRQGLLAVERDSLLVHDLGSGAPLGPAPDIDIEPTAAVLSTDAAYLAVTANATSERSARVVVIETSTGSILNDIELDADEATDVELFDLFHLTVVVDGNALEVWDLESERRVVRTSAIDSTPDITSTALAPFGDRLALGRRDGTVELWHQRERLVWTRELFERRHRAEITWVEFDLFATRFATTAIDGSVIIADAGSGDITTGPVGFDTARDVASFFDPDTDEVITMDDDGDYWRWVPDAQGGVIDSTPATVGIAPGGNGPFAGVLGDTVIPLASGTDADLVAQGVLDVVSGHRNSRAVVYRDRVVWIPDPSADTVEIPVRHSVSVQVAVTSDAIAVSQPGAETITVLDGDGSLVKQITTRNPVTRLAVNPSGTQLLYSTNRGEALWYQLDGIEAAVVLESGNGYDVQFVDDDTAVAIGAAGLMWIDVGDDASADAANMAQGELLVAVSADRALAATVDDDDAVQLWDLPAGRPLGAPLTLPSSQAPSWLAFDGETHLLVGTASGTIEIATELEAWYQSACTTLALTSGEARLPGRWSDVEACR